MISFYDLNSPIKRKKERDSHTKKKLMKKKWNPTKWKGK